MSFYSWWQAKSRQQRGRGLTDSEKCLIFSHVLPVKIEERQLCCWWSYKCDNTFYSHICSSKQVNRNVSGVDGNYDWHEETVEDIVKRSRLLLPLDHRDMMRNLPEHRTQMCEFRLKGGFDTISLMKRSVRVYRFYAGRHHDNHFFHHKNNNTILKTSPDYSCAVVQVSVNLTWNMNCYRLRKVPTLSGEWRLNFTTAALTHIPQTSRRRREKTLDETN